MKTKNNGIFKRALCAALSVTLLFSSALFAGAAVRGDYNGDGKVTAEDARLTLRASVGLQKPGATQLSAADMDGDGKLTAADARSILRLSVGLSDFDSVLLSVARRYFNVNKGYGSSATQLPQSGSPVEIAYRTSGKWCCYYTIHDIFRVALREAGYSEARIEQLAPLYYPSNKVAKAAESVTETKISSLFISSKLPVYMPSLLLDYYRTNSGKYDTVYTFYNYYDDVITYSYFYSNSNNKNYKPKVGDVVFMSNKQSTYVNGYPTVDHTAQIIEVYSDGTFLCTEGSIIIDGVPDKLPRVRERVYKYDKNAGTYLYVNNSIVKVLAIARPDLDGALSK